MIIAASSTVKLADRFYAQARKAFEWALPLVSEEEGFRGAGPFINAYYKAPTAFISAGYGYEARVLTSFIARTFHKEGDFHNLPNDPTALTLNSYRNAWIARGMHAAGRYDLALGAYARMARTLSPSGGAVTQSLVHLGAAEIEFASTANQVISCLFAGQMEIAERSGHCLLQFIADQPVLDGPFCHRRTLDGTLIAGDISGMIRSLYLTDVGVPDQMYWFLGIGMKALASLARATGKKHWLDGAQNLKARFEHCAPDRFESITNGKVAWGLAEIYDLSGVSKDKEMMLQCIESQIAKQHAGGYWLRSNTASLDTEPLNVTLDTTLERGFQLLEVSRVIAR
jgi:hypothetical protein